MTSIFMSWTHGKRQLLFMWEEIWGLVNSIWTTFLFFNDSLHSIIKIHRHGVNMSDLGNTGWFKMCLNFLEILPGKGGMRGSLWGWDKICKCTEVKICHWKRLNSLFCNNHILIVCISLLFRLYLWPLNRVVLIYFCLYSHLFAFIFFKSCLILRSK